MLFEKFKVFIQNHRLIADNDKIILAVSGGIDSMVMMALFTKLGNRCIVAHCNFGLRGNESEDDEKFVNEQTVKLNLPFISKRFDTTEYANAHKISIQMAARELRYNWFRHLCEAHQCQSVAVAHNRDDVLETFFINLGRGTGIKGLIGIQPKNDNIIRPLLFASRAEINSYSGNKNIPFREDSSNASDKYQRNFIRHQILPTFEEIFPKFRDTQTANIAKLTEAENLYQFALDLLIHQVYKRANDCGKIDITRLLATPAPQTVLYEILVEFNFTPPTIGEIFEGCNAISGKQYFSTTHKLVKDRECFIIDRIDNAQQHKYYIEINDTQIKTPINLELKIFEKAENFIPEKENTIALLDYDKLAFPLILRRWNTGDYFIPLGMEGIKKLSDFFIDQKLSIIEKEKTWILASGPDIAWIIGHRIDNRFKITQHTQRILQIAWMK
jgi:tRNA(Ile)-lysidine synthase